MPAVIERACTKCLQVKSLEEFYYQKTGPLGRRSQCKVCHKAWSRTNVGKAYQAAYGKVWSKTDVGKASIAKAYYTYNQTDKGKARRIRDNQKLPNRFNAAIRQATKRHLHWTLTLTEWEALIVNQVCHYCNGPLNLYGSALDRIDNSKGYEVRNVVPCCKNCNRIKGDSLTYPEMVVVINALMAYRGNQLNISQV